MGGASISAYSTEPSSRTVIVSNAALSIFDAVIVVLLYEPFR